MSSAKRSSCKNHTRNTGLKTGTGYFFFAGKLTILPKNFRNMEYQELIAVRHSVRKFSDKPVDRSLLDEMIDDALLAPSSRNSKSSGFMIIEDRSTLEEMSRMRDYGSGLIAGAAAAIVVLGDTTKTDLWVDNAAISTTYLLLSAVERGLGACWVHVNGRPRVKSDPAQGTAEDFLRELLGIKDEMRPYSVVAVGYPKE